MNALDTLTLGRCHGVSPAAMHALLAILSDPPMKPSVIAKLTGMTAAAITGSMDRLHECGMIERPPYGHDRRVRLATPTERAFELFATALAVDG